MYYYDQWLPDRHAVGRYAEYGFDKESENNCQGELRNQDLKDCSLAASTH